jgi:hypothetical protein
VRINVYSQELTKEVSLVKKTSENGVEHFGVRLFFDGSPRLHNRPDDDDRSAITYWLPHNDKFGPRDLQVVFQTAANILASMKQG